MAFPLRDGFDTPYTCFHVDSEQGAAQSTKSGPTCPKLCQLPEAVCTLETTVAELGTVSAFVPAFPVLPLVPELPLEPEDPPDPLLDPELPLVPELPELPVAPEPPLEPPVEPVFPLLPVFPLDPLSDPEFPLDPELPLEPLLEVLLPEPELEPELPPAPEPLPDAELPLLPEPELPVDPEPVDPWLAFADAIGPLKLPPPPQPASHKDTLNARSALLPYPKTRGVLCWRRAFPAARRDRMNWIICKKGNMRVSTIWLLVGGTLPYTFVVWCIARGLVELAASTQSNHQSADKEGYPHGDSAEHAVSAGCCCWPVVP